MRRLMVCLAVGVLPFVVSDIDTSGLQSSQLQAAAIDNDQDGIPDAWEEDGVDVTLPSGVKQRLNLKADGASSRHKDIFVWIEWM